MSGTRHQSILTFHLTPVFSATWFYQHNTAGACGTVHQDTDKVIALDSDVYDSGSHCGKTVMLVNLSNGKTTTATVADECPTCDSKLSIDLSQGAFGALTDNDYDLGEFDSTCIPLLPHFRRYLTTCCSRMGLPLNSFLLRLLSFFSVCFLFSAVRRASPYSWVPGQPGETCDKELYEFTTPAA